VIGPSTRPDATSITVSAGGCKRAASRCVQNCGNMLAGVAPFASKMASCPSRRAHPRPHPYGQYSKYCRRRDSTPDGQVQYNGDASIDGVPEPQRHPPRLSRHSRLELWSVTATGNAVDVIDGVEATLIDNGMPVVVMRASTWARPARNPPRTGSGPGAQGARRAIRLDAGRRMNLGYVTRKTVPNVFASSQKRAARSPLAISSRTRFHKAIGVLAQ